MVLPNPAMLIAQSMIRPSTSTLSVMPALSSLLPQGALSRGTVVGVSGPAMTSLALALFLGPSQQGCWGAVAGLPALNLETAEHLGIRLDHLVVIPHLGANWLDVVGVLIDACEVVVIVPPYRCQLGDARRMMARVRERQSIVVLMNRDAKRSVWPEALDLEFSARSQSWSGLGYGHGALGSRQMEIVSAGRRSGGRERRTTLELPAPLGGASPQIIVQPQIIDGAMITRLTG